jgi:hypothetical protein
MSDERERQDDDTIVALPVYQPDVTGARPWSRAELEELLSEQTRLSVVSVQQAAADMTRSAAALDQAVHAARSAGASWTDIGRAVGITRQSAQQRWAR